jgi:S-adenosylmethionine-diacylgycerolhomoserine-N-methlytransferase
MLAAAENKLRRSSRVRLALADAQDPCVGQTFDAEGYEGVLMSYSLSMVPNWSLALQCALGGLKVGGRLSIVDFGCFEGWGRFGPVAIESLTRHDAPPLLCLRAEALELDPKYWRAEHQSICRGWVQTLVITRLQ